MKTIMQSYPKKKRSPLRPLEEVNLKCKLFLAIERGDSATASDIFQKGIDVDTRIKRHCCWNPVINLSVEKDDFNMVCMMIQLGASVNQRGIQDRTPLHAAVSLAMVKLLVENNADVNTQDGRGNTPLHFACEKGNLDIIDYLLANGADIQTGNHDGITPLLRTAARGNKEMLEALVKRGADPYAVDNHKNNWLLLAPLEYEINKFMCQITPEAIVQRNTSGLNHIHDICLDLPATTAILDVALQNMQTPYSRAAEVFVMDSHSKFTCVHLAVQKDAVTALKKLISSGANVNAVDDEGRTPLDIFYLSPSSIDCLLFLLSCGGKASGKYETSPEIIEIVKQSQNFFPLLQILCRQSLQAYYGTSLGKIFKHYNVPPYIRRFLFFEEI